MFDIVLLWIILISVFVVILNSIAELRVPYGQIFSALEWAFTIVFTIEYFLRFVCVRNPASYAFSFFGIVDLLAVMPTYVALLVVDAHYLMVVRALRLLRIFRIFKLVRYLKEADVLTRALRASLPKITVFITAILTIVVVVGSLMYVVEGEENGFKNIPVSIYWAVVTLTTVGYGDIAPKTSLGQFLACIVMILGYAIIAVPTGIVSVEHRQRPALPQKSVPVAHPIRTTKTRLFAANAVSSSVCRQLKQAPPHSDYLLDARFMFHPEIKIDAQ